MIDAVDGSPETMPRDIAIYLAARAVGWEQGDTDVTLPDTIEECTEFAERIAALRSLIEIRDTDEANGGRR